MLRSTRAPFPSLARSCLFIMSEPELTIEEYSQVIDQLVFFGIIYKLSSSPRSDTVFILRPQQLANVYACVVTKNPETLIRVKRLSKEGILDHSDSALKSVWGMYPAALWRCSDSSGSSPDSDIRLSLFLRLLHYSGLAYEVFDRFGLPQGRSIVPCILPDRPAGFDGDVSNDSELLMHFVPEYMKSIFLSLEKLQISFTSMPFTFFAQLLAGLSKLATDGGAWRNGAVLSAGVSFALLREERSGISVSLLGKNRSVRSVILLIMLQVVQKFSSMTISDVTLTVMGRKWSGDDVKESLHFGHGVLHSAMIQTKVEVHSLWMLFPLPRDREEESDIFPGELGLLQRMVRLAKAVRSLDFLVLINHYLQRCMRALLQIMKAPRLLKGDDVPRPLWVVLQQRTEDNCLTYCAMPFFPHYVPDEPWMALEAVGIPFIPESHTVADAELVAVKELLSDCFASMRGSLADILPSGWELALPQSLAGLDPDLMAQQEKLFFVCVGSAVFSKDFATKAQAMKTVSLRKNPSPPQESIGSTLGTATPISVPMPASEGISVAAIRSFYEQQVTTSGEMKGDRTTADMLPLVKSLTKVDPRDGSGGAGLSFCQLLRQQNASSSDEVGPATVFISHAWKYNFLEFLRALEVRFKDQTGVRLWIDIFSHNQHDELTSDEWITEFEQHIKRIKNTVMIVFPWDNPIPFTRAWCLLEVFYNTKNNVPFEVYLTEEQRRLFVDLAKQDLGKAMLIFSRISTRQSTCWVLNDQLRIHSLIESSVGFEAVDRHVHEAIAKALQVDQTQSLQQKNQPASQPSRTVTVPLTSRKEVKDFLQWLRDHDKLQESTSPSSIDVTVYYDP